MGEKSWKREIGVAAVAGLFAAGGSCLALSQELRASEERLALELDEAETRLETQIDAEFRLQERSAIDARDRDVRDDRSEMYADVEVAAANYWNSLASFATNLRAHDGSSGSKIVLSLTRTTDLEATTQVAQSEYRSAVERASLIASGPAADCMSVHSLLLSSYALSLAKTHADFNAVVAATLSERSQEEAGAFMYEYTGPDSQGDDWLVAVSDSDWAVEEALRSDLNGSPVPACEKHSILGE